MQYLKTTSMLTTYKSLLVAIISIFSLSLCAQIVNIEGKRIATDTTGFAGKIGINLNASKYRDSYVAADIHTLLQYKTRKNIYFLITDYQVVNAGGEDFNNSGFLHLRYNRKLSEAVRLEIFTQAQYSTVTKIELRVLNGLGFRMKLSPYERAKFYWGVAAMLEHEEVKDEVTQDDIRLSSYFTFTLRPEKTVTFTNTTYAQPRADNFSDYRISNNTKLVFDITTKLKFVTDFSFLYDTKPPLEIPKVNYQVKNGLTYRL